MENLLVKLTEAELDGSDKESCSKNLANEAIAFLKANEDALLVGTALIAVAGAASLRSFARAAEFFGVDSAATLPNIALEAEPKLGNAFEFPQRQILDHETSQAFPMPPLFSWGPAPELDAYVSEFPGPALSPETQLELTKLKQQPLIFFDFYRRSGAVGKTLEFPNLTPKE